MGAGHPTPCVPIYTRTFPWPTRHSSTVVGNPTGATVWQSAGPTAGECPWARAGVWRWSAKKNAPVVLQEDYFAKDRVGRKVDFYSDFYYPFVQRWEAVVKARQPAKCRMVEAVPNEFCPEWPESARPGNFVYTPHWYVAQH